MYGGLDIIGNRLRNLLPLRVAKGDTVVGTTRVGIEKANMYLRMLLKHPSGVVSGRHGDQCGKNRSSAVEPC
jgi:hypothetical protein